MRIVILPRPRVGRLGAGACCCGRLPAAAGAVQAESGPTMRMRGFTAGVLLQAQQATSRAAACLECLRSGKSRSQSGFRFQQQQDFLLAG
eukprot:SAG25_NODE_165_length_13094_cov_31.386149_5_plen_90_part_00